jgi:hypothetical protein
VARHPKIQPIGPNEKKHIFWGMHGHSSSGKTRFISTLENTLVIRPPIEHTESVKNPAAGVMEWQVEDWNEMSGDVIDYLYHHGKDHAFVWLDSVSGWQDVGLDEIWADTVAKYPHRKGTPIDRGEYNANFVRLAQWCRTVVKMDLFNFGFTSWPEELEDEEGRTLLMPWVQGKNMANRFVGYMKLVTYLERKETGPKDDKKMVRVMRWGETSSVYTKDQYGLPEKGFLVNPTMPKMMELIQEARKPARSPKRTPRKRTGTKPVRRRRAVK